MVTEGETKIARDSPHPFNVFQISVYFITLKLRKKIQFHQKFLVFEHKRRHYEVNFSSPSFRLFIPLSSPKGF